MAHIGCKHNKFDFKTFLKGKHSFNLQSREIYKNLEIRLQNVCKDIEQKIKQ